MKRKTYKNDIDNLLSPLGCVTIWRKVFSKNQYVGNRLFILNSSNNEEVYLLPRNQSFFLTEWTSAKDLLKDLFTSKKIVKINRCEEYENAMNSIVNPYFGCQSLEEALIKKDLMVNGNN